MRKLIRLSTTDSFTFKFSRNFCIFTSWHNCHSFVIGSGSRYLKSEKKLTDVNKFLQNQSRRNKRQNRSFKKMSKSKHPTVYKTEINGKGSISFEVVCYVTSLFKIKTITNIFLLRHVK